MIRTTNRLARGSAALVIAVALFGLAPASVQAQTAQGTDGPPDRSLTDTYWKLVGLEDRAIQLAPNQREPHLILQAASGRLIGSGGCNRMMGSYTLDGRALSFGQVAATRMACIEAMEQEAAFFQALDQVREWRVSGDALELLDQRGSVVARLVAVDLK